MPPLPPIIINPKVPISNNINQNKEMGNNKLESYNFEDYEFYQIITYSIPSNEGYTDDDLESIFDSFTRSSHINFFDEEKWSRKGYDLIIEGRTEPPSPIDWVPPTCIIGCGFSKTSGTQFCSIHLKEHKNDSHEKINNIKQEYEKTCRKHNEKEIKRFLNYEVPKIIKETFYLPSIGSSREITLTLKSFDSFPID